MEPVAYRVLTTCQIGADAATCAVRFEGTIIDLPEAVGDASPYVERVVPLAKKKPPITSG